MGLSRLDCKYQEPQNFVIYERYAHEVVIELYLSNLYYSIYNQSTFFTVPLNA